MKRRIRLIARQAWVFMATYFLVALIVSSRSNHIPWFTTAFDRAIPFVPLFVWAYISAYALATFGLWYATRYMDDGEFKNVLTACYVNIFLFSFCHLLFPRMAIKPHVDTASLSGIAMACVQKLTTPYNTFPSAHVSYALIIAWAAIASYSKNRITSCILVADAALIIASTLLVKEHTVLDVCGGLCVGFISIAAAKIARKAIAARSTG